MAEVIWQGNAAAIEQVDTATPANVQIGDVFTSTLTDEAGNTAAVSFTATAATVANVTAGVTAAWNASGDFRFARVTAADSTTHVTLTADTAGQPFYLATTETDGGTSDTQTFTRAASTASSGPYDAGCAANWSTGIIPAGNEHTTITGTVSILYGLQKLVNEVDDFIVREYSGTIGGTDGGYLQIDMGAADIFDFESTGQAWIDLTDYEGSTNAATVRGTATAPTTGYGLSLKCTKLEDLTILGGDVGYGVAGGDTTSLCDNFHVADATLTIGKNVTNVAAADITTVNQYGGTVHCNANVATVEVHNSGRFYHDWGTDATNPLSTKGYIYDGEYHTNTIGAYTAFEVHSAGKLLNTSDVQAKTVTDCTAYNGATISDPMGKLTLTNAVEFPSGHDACTLDLGPSRKFTVADI